MASLDEETVLLRCSESILTCQICMERFESPRILPCQHTFCKLCVLSLIKKHCVNQANDVVKSEFPCPNCRKSCKIRSKTYEEAKLLKAFPESLLLKDLLEAAEADKDKSRQSRGEKISVEFATAGKVRDSMYRYTNILIAIQHLLQNLPSREQHIRRKLASFTMELTDAARKETIPELGHEDHDLKMLLSRVTEEEYSLRNTYTVDAMQRTMRKVADTPCVDGTQVITQEKSHLQSAVVPGYRAGAPEVGHVMSRIPRERRTFRTFRQAIAIATRKERRNSVNEMVTVLAIIMLSLPVLLFLVLLY